jgi:hypothetical protein
MYAVIITIIEMESGNAQAFQRIDIRLLTCSREHLVSTLMQAQGSATSNAAGAACDKDGFLLHLITLTLEETAW